MRIYCISLNCKLATPILLYT